MEEELKRCPECGSKLTEGLALPIPYCEKCRHFVNYAGCIIELHPASSGKKLPHCDILVRRPSR